MAAVAANEYKTGIRGRGNELGYGYRGRGGGYPTRRGQIKVAKFCNHVGRILLATTQKTARLALNNMSLGGPVG